METLDESVGGNSVAAHIPAMGALVRKAVRPRAKTLARVYKPEQRADGMEEAMLALYEEDAKAYLARFEAGE